MSENTDNGALTPEAATAQRSTLMADAGFRQRAAAGGAEWDTLAKLNQAIAAGMPDDEEPPTQQQQPQQQAAPADDGDDEPANYEAPASPAEYRLPFHLAQQAGLDSDPMAGIELVQGLHACGVDTHMAHLLFTAAVTAASRPATAVQQAGEYHASETALRRSWGASFDANLAAAGLEARRVFDALPASVTGGADFKDWCAASGLGNNRVLVENFYLRSKARAG